MRNYEMKVTESIHAIRDAGMVPDLENMLYDLEMCPEGYRSDYDDLSEEDKEQVIAEVKKEIKSRFVRYRVTYINPFFIDKKEVVFVEVVNEVVFVECVNEDDAEAVVKGMEHYSDVFDHYRMIEDVVSVEKIT